MTLFERKSAYEYQVVPSVMEGGDYGVDCKLSKVW